MSHVGALLWEIVLAVLYLAAAMFVLGAIVGAAGAALVALPFVRRRAHPRRPHEDEEPPSSLLADTVDTVRMQSQRPSTINVYVKRPGRFIRPVGIN